MYAFEEESIGSKIAEIGTWVLLFVLLVPGTALGFFAEKSLPTSPLYPVKRDIEAVILTLVSVNNGTKSAYELSLANTRFSETKQLIASNAPLTPQQLNTVTVQLAAAQTSINSISDSVQKAQLQQQLHTTVNAYQTQIAQLQQQLQNSPATTSRSTQHPQEQVTAQPTTTLPQSAPVQQTIRPSSPTPTTQQAHAGTEQVAAQPSPTVATSTTISSTQNLTPDQRQALEEQLQQLQDQLQNFQNQTQPTQYPNNDYQYQHQTKDR